MKLLIVNDAPGNNVGGRFTQVYVEDEDGVQTDISSMVRSADVRIRMDELLTAKLEVYVTGVSARAEAESVVVKHIGPRKFWQRLRDVSTFRRDGGREFA